ncbi:MAG: SusC/RagA family TonB-linked outer membrane protein [Bacteroidota bacterium]
MIKNLKSKTRHHVHNSAWLCRICSRVSLILAIFLMAAFTVFAQNESKSNLVTGIVTSSNAEPMEGVSVTVRGGNAKAVTNADGRFSIQAGPNASLIFSSEGYVSITEGVSGRKEILVSLKEFYEEHEAKDYVNKLYGRQRKEYVSSAISQIYGNLTGNSPVISNGNKLAGVLPGLFVMQNNGEPGDEGASFWLRGKRTLRGKGPVVMVDGVERSMEFLDPSDIETVTVLKDAASTAQYGMRGGNGVLLVTTKRGEGGKIKVTFNARGGIKEPTTKPRFLDAYDYATLYNEAQRNDNPSQALMFNSVDLAKYMQAREGTLTGLDPYLYPNIDWYGDYVRDYTWQQRYSVNIDGGNKFAKYFVSGGYTLNNGLYNVDKTVNSYNTNASMDMFTLRSNIDIDVTDQFKMSLDLAGKQEQRTYPGSRTDAALRVFRSLYKTPPMAHPVLSPDGKIAGTKDYTNNPYGLLNYQGYSLYYTRMMAATLTMVHDLDFITDGLKIMGKVSFDSYYEQTTLRNKNFKVYQITTVLNADGTRTPVYMPNGTTLKYIETGTDTQMGSGGEYNDAQRLLNYDLGLDYARTFGSHDLVAWVGFNQREIGQENNANLPRFYRGFNGRLAYVLASKYLAEFNVGYQASEQMPPWAKYTLFPAGSVGWIVSREDFLKDSKIINFLKVRASHGLSGWDDIGGYFIWYQQFASSGGINYGNTAVSYAGWNEGAFALNNVQPERVRKSNIGFDATLFGERISISADYFKERNSRIMVQPELPFSMGIRFPDMPIAIVENEGFDFQLGYNDHIGKLQYSVTGVMTKADNTVIERGEAAKRYEYQLSTGRPLNPVFGLVALGLFQSQEEIDSSPRQTFGVTKVGDIKYLDVNDDDVIDSYDETYLGTNADPKIQYGINLALKYGNFDFTALVTGQEGGKIYMGGEAMYEFHDNGTVREHHLGRFNPEDESTWATATYPRLSLANKANNQRTSTYWARSTEMVRLKTMELGYTLPEKLSRSLKMQNIRFYVNGYNLLTWQSSDLMDIEARSTHYVIYPIQKILNAGVNVTF